MTDLRPFRIASLLPSATEIVAALGLGDTLVGVSHECDYPLGVEKLPRLTRSAIPEGLSSELIDQAVRHTLHEEGSLYHLDEERLNELAPNFVITQALCDVCAVNYRTVARVVGTLKSPAELISLEPSSIEDIFADIRTVARALGVSERGEALSTTLAERVARLAATTKNAPRPRVLALEWFSPAFYGGHWVPEQIEAAGGLSIVGRPRERSEGISTEEVLASDPDVLLLMPCGADLAKTLSLLPEILDGPLRALRALRTGNTYALDANGYFSRPGPRVAQGAELLGHILHPELVPLPADVPRETAFAQV